MTKLDALNRLATVRDLTAAALAEELRTSTEASGMMLIRLMRQGLVVREFDAGMYIYNLTPKGHARHVFLNAQTSKITG